jgi:hypothetical protein
MHTLIEAHKIAFENNFVRFYQCMHGASKEIIIAFEDMHRSSHVPTSSLNTLRNNSWQGLRKQL